MKPKAEKTLTQSAVQKPQAQETLQLVKGYFEQAVNHPAYRAWQQEARQAWAFYDGEQWSAEEKEKLEENGQPAIVINKLASKIDNVAGAEVVGRTRIVYRSRSGDAGEEQAARTLTDLALYVAERNNQATEISATFRAGLVCGIGWLDVGVEQAAEGPFVFNRVEDEFNVVWDPLSRRADMSDARFVCRERWLDESALRSLFDEPAASQALALLKNTTRVGSGQVTFGLQGFGRVSGPEVSYIDPQTQRLRVVEVQFTRSEKEYTIRLNNGKTVRTFEKKASLLADAAAVESAYVARPYAAYFTDNILLQCAPVPYGGGGFTLIPFIYKRNKADGRPYGLLRAAIDPQRELNKRRSKAMHLLNTAQVIADVDAVEDPTHLAREAARPDGLILKRPGKELRIVRNTDLAQSQVGVMDQAARDIQDVMGVYDELVGKQSNATSGIAIAQRQMAGTQNQMFAFDALRQTKRQLGLRVLQLIRQFFTADMVIQITDDLAAPQQVELTSLQEGGYLATAAFDVLVEEVRDVMSSRELELQQLQLLMQAGIPVPPEVLIEATNLRGKEKLLQGLGRNTQPVAARADEVAV